MTDRTQNADSRRKMQIFADSPLQIKFSWKFKHFGARIFAENRREPQIGLRHLRSVTFSSALISGGGGWVNLGTHRRGGPPPSLAPMKGSPSFHWKNLYNQNGPRGPGD